MLIILDYRIKIAKGTQIFSYFVSDWDKEEVCPKTTAI